MEKKNVAIIILAIALIGSGVGNIVTLSMLGLIEPTAPPPKQEVIAGTIETVIDLDPAYAYDTASSAVIENVAESLYTINWSDPLYTIIPMLAAALPTISPDGLEYTIPLRTGIYFHDGTIRTLPCCVIDADYLINIPLLKKHPIKINKDVKGMVQYLRAVGYYHMQGNNYLDSFSYQLEIMLRNNRFIFLFQEDLYEKLISNVNLNQEINLYCVFGLYVSFENYVIILVDDFKE